LLIGTIRDVKMIAQQGRLRVRSKTHLLMEKSLYKTATLEQIPRTWRKRRITARKEPLPGSAWKGLHKKQRNRRKKTSKTIEKNGKTKHY
jgi:hypothetical protein